jgi:hypothetical protein
MGLSVFNFHPEDFEQRSSLLLSVVFTAVAFKLLVTAELPNVPYSTILGGYLDAGLVLLWLLFVETTAIIHFQIEQQSQVDAVFAKGFLGLWILYNAWFVLSKVYLLRRLVNRLGPQHDEQSTAYKASTRRKILNELQQR